MTGVALFVPAITPANARFYHANVYWVGAVSGKAGVQPRQFWLAYLGPAGTMQLQPQHATSTPAVVHARQRMHISCLVLSSWAGEKQPDVCTCYWRTYVRTVTSMTVAPLLAWVTHVRSVHFPSDSNLWNRLTVAASKSPGYCSGNKLLSNNLLHTAATPRLQLLLRPRLI